MRYSALLLIAICFLCGCGSSGGGGRDGGQPAKLRVIVGGWDLPSISNLSVKVDGANVETVSYPSQFDCPEVCQQLSDYMTVKSGGVNFEIVAPGSTTNLVPSEFQTLNLAPNTQNTFVLSSSTASYVFADDGAAADGSVKLRIASVGEGGVSAWVNTDGSTAGDPTVSGIELGSVSSYLTFTPGRYVVTTSLSCLFTPNCIKIGPAALAANQNVTVYILNEGQSFSMLILADN